MKILGTLGAFALSAISALANETTKPSLPANVPEEYVITPFGYFHPSCVKQVAEGEAVLPDGRVSHVDGTVDASAQVCNYPHFSPAGELMSDQPSPTEAATSLACGAPWIECITDTTGSSFRSLQASWAVPPEPVNNDGQVLFFFPGLEDINNGVSILQPVLQYGVSRAGGGNYWSIASWNQSNTHMTYFSKLVPVGPGDQISGDITSNCEVGSHSCPTWNVSIEDKNTKTTAVLHGTSSYDQVWNWAFGAVLEAYNIKRCGDYPSNSGVEFTVTLHNELGDEITDAPWAEHPARKNIAPYCNFNLKATDTKETVGYGIPGLFNTGLDNNNKPLAGGATDPHYKLITSEDSDFPGPTAKVVFPNGGYPIPPWMPDGPSSEWIAPSANERIINTPGLYVYEITFSLNGLDPSTTVITGQWSTDNNGVDILINGKSTGNTNTNGFSSFTPFTIKSGFVSGRNKLDFQVSNGPTGGVYNPTGLRVEISGTTKAEPNK